MKNLIKKLSKVILLFAIMFAVTITIVRPTQADVGFHSSYSGGSSSSSSHRSSSSSSHRSSGSSSRRSSSGSSEEMGAASIIVVLIIFVIVIVMMSKTKGEARKFVTSVTSNMMNTSDNTKAVEEQIKQIDPMFSAENFMSFGKEVYIKLQNAWMDRKWEEIRPFESNELFEQHRQQLQSLIDANQINVMERICVRHTYLNSFRQDGDKELLTMTLKAAMKDYIIDEDTKKVIQGNPNEDVYMVYQLTFMRKAGVKTKEGTDKTSTTNCPNCGAPTKITSSGKCEYCGSIITTGEHDWVLSSLEGSRGM